MQKLHLFEGMNDLINPLKEKCSQTVPRWTKCPVYFIMTTALYKSRYRKYAIWPRDGACHADHACAALTVSRSCRQALFSSIENVHRYYTNPWVWVYNRHVLKDTIMIYWDIWLHFQNLSGLSCHPIKKFRILAFILFISRSISIRKYGTN